jgi:hypothetical protein
MVGNDACDVVSPMLKVGRGTIASSTSRPFLKNALRTLEQITGGGASYIVIELIHSDLSVLADPSASEAICITAPQR